ncbi:23S rRNA (uracil(1939)-C(5))-methyltransferase RlmD [Candidatus Woesearchaeota archaeon]|nr:23S rRNA (uracil(1939)-C(5))-methyltransferase RlmD [Candidatus Woesearchaeota archaeon]
MATPLCPYFGKCGGCSAQHIEYSLQAENKKNTLAHALGGSFEPGSIQLFTGKEYFYRSRVDMAFHKGGLGFREKKRWNEIVDVEQCVIAEEAINVLIKEIREFFGGNYYFDRKRNTGTIKYAVIRCSSLSSAVSFVLNKTSPDLKEVIAKITSFAQGSSAENVLVTYSAPEMDESTSGDYFAVKGTDMLKEAFLGKTFLFNAQGFFQNNRILAEKMLEHVHGLLKKHDTNNAALLDLYGGVGTFGITNAELFRDVFIVESASQSIQAAEKNILENQIKNAKAFCLDANQIRRLGLTGITRPIFAVTDPPRSGMEMKAISALKELKPKVIVYISCNALQLKKDLKKFQNYAVKSAALLDFFPQTLHMESVVELERA